jgi:hypothetical protein
MTTREQHHTDQLDVLAAVSAACHKPGQSVIKGEDVFAIVNALGDINARLLGTKRERAMSELHKLGLISIVRREGGRAFWAPTPAGAIALSMRAK